LYNHYQKENHIYQIISFIKGQVKVLPQDFNNHDADCLYFNDCTIVLTPGQKIKVIVVKKNKIENKNIGMYID